LRDSEIKYQRAKTKNWLMPEENDFMQ